MDEDPPSFSAPLCLLFAIFPLVVWTDWVSKAAVPTAEGPYKSTPHSCVSVEVATCTLKASMPVVVYTALFTAEAVEA